jgi:hypothetical protein
MNWPCVNCVSDKLFEWPAHVFTWQVIDLAMCFIFVSDKLGDLLNLMCLLEKFLTCPCVCLCFWQVGWPAHMFTWQVIDLAMCFICVSDKLGDLLMCLLEKLLTCPCVYLCTRWVTRSCAYLTIWMTWPFVTCVSDKLVDLLMCLFDNLFTCPCVLFVFHKFSWHVLDLVMCFICSDMLGDLLMC